MYVRMSRLRSTRGIDSASTHADTYISRRARDATIIVIYLRMHVVFQTILRTVQGVPTLAATAKSD